MINPKGSRSFTGSYKQTEKKSINPSRQGQSYKSIQTVFSEAVLEERTMKGQF